MSIHKGYKLEIEIEKEKITFHFPSTSHNLMVGDLVTFESIFSECSRYMVDGDFVKITGRSFYRHPNQMDGFMTLYVNPSDKGLNITKLGQKQEPTSVFTDLDTGLQVYAPLNATLIRATHRPQDLIPVFLKAIRDLPQYTQIVADGQNDPELSVIFDPSATDDDKRWEGEYLCSDFLEELFDVLNLYAPDGYLFGAHVGDGSDYGYWKSEDYE